MTRIVKQQHRIGYSTKTSSDRSIFAFYGTHAMNYFCVFGDFYASGMQDAEVTKSLDTLQIRKQMLSGFRR